VGLTLIEDAAMRRLIFDAKVALAQRPERRAAADFRAAESLAPPALRRLQHARASAMARHAFTTTDYYRERFSAAGFSEKDLSEPENWAHLPRLTKDDIRIAGQAMFSDAVTDRRRLLSRTGGSTGIPLSVYNDDNAPTAAMWWRVYRWWGIHPGDHVAFIYRQARSGITAVQYAARWWPTRHLLLDARNTSTAAIEEFSARWQRLRPSLLVGYVEGVHEFARYLHETGTTLPSPQAISVTASGLQPGQRRFIEATFNAPVYDTYRSAEVPWIAAECGKRTGLHVQADTRRLEILTSANTPAGPGQTGDVVLTDLMNYAFPLIRYEIGDRAQTIGGDCTCGSSLPRISALQGRRADVVHTPSGRRISGGYGGLFNRWPELVRQFQIHQSEDYVITLRFVPAGDERRAVRAAEEVARTITDFVDGEVPVRLAVVDRIDHDGGKVRLVTSDVTRIPYTSERRDR